jgi:hypothetical protein
MRLKTLLFLGAITLSNSLFAQDKYGPGYYLAAGADTIRGFVEYRSNYNYEFKFKKNLKEESKTYTIDEVSQFGLDYGITYQKLDFALEGLSIKPVFAQVLVQGEIDLYEYQSRLFLDGGENRKFLMAKGKGGNSEDVQKNYQKNAGIFNILFFDCPTIKEEALKSTINKTTLTNLVIKYHDCKKISNEQLNQLKKRQVKYGFHFGVSVTNLAYNSSNYLARSTFNNPSQNITFGITSFNYGRKASSVVSLQQELFFSHASFEGSSYLSYETGGYLITETSVSKIAYSKFAYKIGPRFSVRSNTINPYISLGLVANTFMGVNASSTVISQINSSIENKDEIPLNAGVNGGIWASVGLGKMINEHLIFIDFVLENNYVTNSGKLTSVSARIGYLF